MRALYIEPFSGISGNMFIGAMLDAGVPFDWLKAQLEKMELGDYALLHKSVNKLGIQASYFNVLLPEEHVQTCGHDDVHTRADETHGKHCAEEKIHEHEAENDKILHKHAGEACAHEHTHAHHHAHRNYADICAILDRANLTESLRAQAKKVFLNLAQAEAKVHGSTVEEIHFHEVGAIDCIVDIVGSLLALDYLKIDKIFTGLIFTGRGFVQCAHGVMPVPAPATAELLCGLPHIQGEAAAELTTPTGAALLKTLAEPMEDLPAGFKAERIGYGAGTRDIAQHPNVLRIVLGEFDENAERVKAIAKAAPTALAKSQRGALTKNIPAFEKPDVPSVKRQELPGAERGVSEAGCPDEGEYLELEANIDDLNPEIFPYVLKRLLDDGALDAWIEPIIMKKGRPAHKLCVLTTEDLRLSMETIIYTETSTIGIRSHVVQRSALVRRELKVETPWGEVRAKAAYLHGFLVNVAPEFEDCARLAAERELPLKLLMDGAKSVALKQAEPDLN